MELDDVAVPIDTKRKRRLAVLTSGGDAAGMSACVRAVVRMGLNRGCETFIIREGWEGLIQGNTVETKPVVDDDSPLAATTPFHAAKPGTTTARSKRFLGTYGEGEKLKDGEVSSLKGRHIIQVGWDDVRGFLQAGGTLIGTARSAEFREFTGRTKAAYNLVKHGIDALVVCGGDGSLTGADRLRAEWPEHLAVLVKENKITEETAEKFKYLNIAGVCLLPCVLHVPIDVALPMCQTDTGADFLFVPESPPDSDDWQSEMCEVIQRHRGMGKRKNIVIVAEGAIDKHLNHISPEQIKTVLANRLGLDTRVTTLGHVQRGGRPCAFDRLLATLQGIAAVEALLLAKPGEPSPVIGIEENKVTRKPLMDAVALTQAVTKHIQAKEFDQALALRDAEFAECLNAFRATTRLDNALELPQNQRLNIGIIHIGAPAGGMNTATRTAVQYCLARGHKPLGIYNSFPGLLQDHVSELAWLQVDDWTTRGGSELGTSRHLPDIDLQGVAAAFKKHNLGGLMVIGGFEALSSLLVLEKGRQTYDAFKIPIVHVPATISNNVPISEWSLGSDTSINVLVDSKFSVLSVCRGRVLKNTTDCDIIKQSASASRRRVFVVETQGGTCGYIAKLGALASGALVVYIPEIGMNLEMVASDVRFLKERYNSDPQGKSEGRLVILSEKASKVYKTDVLTDILSDEGGKVFDARNVRLGHTLQGGVPTPRDRTRATRLAVRAIQFIERHAAGIDTVPSLLHHKPDHVKTDTSEEHDIGTIVIQGAKVRTASLREMENAADMKNRRGKTAWWMNLKEMVTMLSGRLDLDSDVKLSDVLNKASNTATN